MSSPDIPIGTLVRGGEAVAAIRALLPHGFESFQLFFWQTIPDDLDLFSLADEVRALLAGSGAQVSSLGVFGNPLAADEAGAVCRRSWQRAIDAAPAFGCDLVCGFTGRLADRPIPESMPRFAEVFAPLRDRAGAAGQRIAFENCSMGGDWQRGDWNLAHNPDAWELLFAALPGDNLGLEWEPCHQMIQLIEPLPQIEEWASRLFHIHGKDATIRPHILRRHGINGATAFAWHRTPGFGDSDWTAIISELRRIGFRGAIDIEGWHDPVYREERELSGQVAALEHLRRCRGPLLTGPC
jgi:sugar phosphate isomerase/epimerase